MRVMKLGQSGVNAINVAVEIYTAWMSWFILLIFLAGELQKLKRQFMSLRINSEMFLVMIFLPGEFLRINNLKISGKFSGVCE